MARRAGPVLCAYTAYIHRNIKKHMLCFVFTEKEAFRIFLD